VGAGIAASPLKFIVKVPALPRSPQWGNPLASEGCVGVPQGYHKDLLVFPRAIGTTGVPVLLLVVIARL
jgi:hypothetical protein